MDCDKETLILSDDKLFYTLEGEGEFVGVPSVFFRLAMCNLTCKGFASKDSPHGCDSYISWSEQSDYLYCDYNPLPKDIKKPKGVKGKFMI